MFLFFYFSFTEGSRTYTLHVPNQLSDNQGTVYLVFILVNFVDVYLQGIKGVWIKLPIELVHLIQAAVQVDNFLG